MVVAAHPLAAREGVAVLARGGNAVDAAVAAAFCLAVVYPQAGNLGGGGFFLVRRPDGVLQTLDCRETAPRGATRDMFLGPDSEPDPEKSLRSVLAAGVPGSVAGLCRARALWGTLPLEDLLAPAIRLAAEGFSVDVPLAKALAAAAGRLRRWPATEAVFYPSGRPAAFGEILRQPDLAATLRRIAKEGRQGFYEGETARRIAGAMAAGGGLITEEDLRGYHAILRPALRMRYRRWEVATMGPPSAGGVSVLQILGILESFDLAKEGFLSPVNLRRFAEATAWAFGERAASLGDPGFTEVPLDRLLDRDRLAAVAARIREGKLPARGGASEEGGSTTHLCVADREGWVVSFTTTINDTFGSGIVVPGAGFLLNNEMDDFAAKTGAPNQFGIPGAAPNAIEPGKRMVSSMAPVIVLENGRPVLALGSPGGGRIVSAVSQTIVAALDFGLDLPLAVDAPRIHHQGVPDVLYYERGRLPPVLRRALETRGYTLRERTAVGRVQALRLHPGGELEGFSDLRGTGLAVGY